MVEITEFIEIDKVTDIHGLLDGPPTYEDVVNQTPEKTRYKKREKQFQMNSLPCL